MATEDRREGDPTPGHAAEGVAPGALSRLLEDLARIPEAEVGETARAPAPGAVIEDRFELRREIGRGGFGVVYDAWDRKLRRGVAFKLVRPGRIRGGEDQLRREAEIAAQLAHPNLVTLFDLGRCEFGPYVVLELLRGETLHGRLERGPVPPHDAVRIAAEIARGLAHAHAHGVVHRDLKPSNVFVGEDGHVKLLDFGMSRAFGWRDVAGGTPAYMAPEQRRGAPEDERTDVYALGVILFEMLSGTLPAAAGGAVPALDAPGAPALGGLVSRMLADDPTERPRDARAAHAALLALLQALQGGAAPGPVRVVPPRPPRARRLLLLGAAAAFLVLLAAAAAWRLRARPEPSPPAARAIAVLAFRNVAGRADEEYFSDGLTEEIRDRLMRVRELKVAGSASSHPFKNATLERSEIARRLRVDVVLEGTVRRERDRLRVGAELVDPRSGFRLWSQIYDRRLEDVFAIQDDIARQVVAALEVVLSRASRDELGRPRTADVVAYDLYLRGRAALRLPRSQQNLDAAALLFEQAIAVDGQLAPAYAGLCDAWLARYELVRARQSFERAEAACHRALTRDPEAGEVYVALGNLHLLSGDARRAEDEFRRAATRASTAVDAYLGLASAHEAQGRPDEAERALAEAKRTAPGDWMAHQRHGILLQRRGRYADAAREFAEAIARSPENATAHNNLGAAHFMAGDLERALEAWRASLALAPTLGAYSNTGSSAFYLGRFEEAAAMYRKAIELAPEDHRLWGNLADAWAQVPGRGADAAAAYRRAIALGDERLRINPRDAETLAEVAAYHASLGLAERARRLSAEALRLEPANVAVRFTAALVALRLGAPAAALDELERAVQLGYPRHLVVVDAGLAPLRQHPRFGGLTAPAGK